MSTEVSITIRAQDQFSETFNQLRSVFDKATATGHTMESMLGAVGGSFEGLAAQAGTAETALADFTQGASDRLGALDADQRARMEEAAQLQEDFSQSFNERALAAEEDFLARKEALHGQAGERLGKIQDAFLTEYERSRDEHNEKMKAFNQSSLEGYVNLYRVVFKIIEAQAKEHGGALLKIVKAHNIAEALIHAFGAANAALTSAPFPFNIPLSALVLAHGMANVERIRQVNIAHGGLESVPEDATFLLRQGERVLSPGQNRELTRFISEGAGEGGSGAVSIENLNIHIMENATSAEALLSMDPSELRQVVSERIIPTLDELARLGIRPQFVETNL